MTAATRSRKPARKPSTAASERADAYQVITDQVIEMLEAGTAPWRKPWNAAGGDGAGLPLSMSSRKPYRGINPFLLLMSAQARGFSSPWWGTYKQITERGGQVRKGEKGTMIVFWKLLRIADQETGEHRQIPLLRTYTVFNADQADGDLGLPPVVVMERTQSEAIAECEAAVRGYLAAGPTLGHGGDAAFYRPSTDHVQMPDRDTFDVTEEYYSALFHELTHSTGHADRLKRPGVVEGHKFGDVLYSREELIAEMGSAFLAGLTGVITVTLPNSAAYLASWVRVLKGEPKMLVQAAANAQRAADLILGVTFEDPAE